LKNPRHIAAETLLQIDSRAAWSNLALDGRIEKYGLDSRDSAFVGALVYGVLERLVTLDACIAAHCRQGIDKLSPAVLAALRLGVYQLLYMDGVPDHAAVGESVELVKKLRKGQAAGFVNGVLRSFLRAGKAIPLPDAPLSARLSVEYACPEPFVKLWLDSYGEEAARRILAASLGKPPLFLRANPLLISADELASRLSAHEGMSVTIDPDLPNCLVAENAGAIHRLPEYRRGFFHVQDKSSQLCALAVDVKPGMRVLDACSAPGGKAFTMAEMMENKGEIVAADLHEHRVKLIGDRAKQMKLDCVTPLAADMTQPNEALGQFDRVLCDVPCSGLGVIRRKPEIKGKNLDDFEKLPGIQYKILETSAQYCKAGGRLIYSTCTLNPAENEAVVSRFLAEHPEFQPAPLPELLGGESQRTILHDWGGDGFYLAGFRKV
jgi:16S rRNA (cytosine967-C5)-methyltransferase